MKKFYPTIYQKTIHDINYQKLKQRGIHCLLFDLDNTIALLDQQKKIEKRTQKLFEKLEKDFKLIIISNSPRKRVEYYAKILNCDYESFALKPLTIKYRKIKRKYGYQKEEMAMIGDQLITDMYAGNKMTSCTILVEPLGTKDLKITSFNRFLEKHIFNYFKRKKIMEKGVYYD